MGLDTTHDCFHGPYSDFMRWRIQLHHVITGEAATRDALTGAWYSGLYEDHSMPINVLMDHSDCDGLITAEQCLPLGLALLELIPRLPADDALEYELSTQGVAFKFAQGLFNAASKGESVEFR